MIQIQHLHKNFGKFEALNDITLAFEPGKVSAVLGPNSAGKTTLIKSILGLVRPDRGDISIDGKHVNGEWLYRARIGYMPQIARFPDNLSMNELFAMIKDIRRASAAADMELFEVFQLQKESEKPLRILSGGTRQKVSAVIAFMFAPDILILDEPTAGLDPVASSHLKDKIQKERDHNKTIILTSHIMSEIEELSERIVFMLEGKVVFDGFTDELIEAAGERNLERAIAQLMKNEKNRMEFRKAV